MNFITLFNGKCKIWELGRCFYPLNQGEKCSSSHQFMLQRKGIYGRNESEGKAKKWGKEATIL